MSSQDRSTLVRSTQDREPFFLKSCVRDQVGPLHQCIWTSIEPKGKLWLGTQVWPYSVLLVYFPIFSDYCTHFLSWTTQDLFVVKTHKQTHYMGRRQNRKSRKFGTMSQLGLTPPPSNLWDIFEKCWPPHPLTKLGQFWISDISYKGNIANYTIK